MSQSLNPARLDLRPTTVRGSAIGGIVAAVVLHAAVVALTLIAWEQKYDFPTETPPSIPVDLVSIADKTNIAPTVDRTVKPNPADEIKPPTDTPTPTPAPPPPVAEAVPPPEPMPAITAKPVPAPPKPDTKPTPEKTKPKGDDFANLLNKLTAPAATPRNARVADRTTKGVGAMNASTMDLIDALRNAITPCWNPPVGAPHPERLVVSFELFLNLDGSVARPPQLTGSAMSSDPFVTAAAEAARRAIYTCAPYKLPADKYNLWRDITIDFDPRKMVQ